MSTEIDALEERLSRSVISAKLTKPKKKKLVRINREKTEPVSEKHDQRIINLVDIPDDWRDVFLAKLSANQKALTKFFFTEIIAFEAAIPVAIEDTLDCVRMATNVESPEFSLGRASNAVQKMVEIRTVRFLSELLGLTPEETALILSEFTDGKELSNVRQTSELLRKLQGSVESLQQVSERTNRRSIRHLESRAAADSEQHPRQRADSRQQKRRT